MSSPWSRTSTWDDGGLTIGGLRAHELADRFGTPSYVLDVADLRSRCREVREAAERAGAEHGVPVAIYYASKAFSATAVLRWAHAEGLRVDTASLGELVTALRAGVPGEAIGLHGNNKSVEEIDTALAHGVGRLVIDSLPEIDLVAERARAAGVVAPVMVRVTTGVHAGGHEHIATAHEDQKFGLSLATGAAREAIDRILATPELHLLGLHSHIGSQILATDGFVTAARALLRLRAQVAAEGGVLLGELDLGGGFGVAYTPDDDAPPVPDVVAALVGEVAAAARELGTPIPALSFEPGRALVGPAVTTLYRVGTVKPVRLDDGGERVYVSVDGGMSDNIRTILYDAVYTAAIASRTSDAPPRLSRVVGKHCESGDIVVRDVMLPGDIGAGDLLAVPVTGAYGRSLASSYNQLPRPGVVAVGDGEPREIVRRETIDDLLALDLG
ncbi:MAG TPA: diaminopimelate decarboxylase [Actinotalea caeni]|uniref:diaminopimelate decarboxylase n=1 Tax=Actinotalea caeni TaxID=1348467 RepID=UPI002B4B2FAA|nr:diaminopimelate decarboxylase [Actinotalea caeni]HLV55317.1 diaminopimelate decarboxylase [Actinotalea caeni]